MIKQTTMDTIDKAARCLAQGAIAGWLAVIVIGGVTGIVVVSILLTTWFMCSWMHMDLHYKLWAEYLDETYDKVIVSETVEEAEMIYDAYKSVTAAIYNRK